MKILDYLRMHGTKNCKKDDKMRFDTIQINPFSFTSWDDFVKNMDISEKSLRCRVPEYYKQLPVVFDSLKRYYKGIVYEGDCAELGGFMDNDDARCYKTFDDQQCAQKLDKESCNADARCRFSKLTNGHECVTRLAWQKEKGKGGFGAGVAGGGARRGGGYAHPLLDPAVLEARTPTEIGAALQAWYKGNGLDKPTLINACNAADPVNSRPKAQDTALASSAAKPLGDQLTVHEFHSLPFPFNPSDVRRIQEAYGYAGYNQLIKEIKEAPEDKKDEARLGSSIWSRNRYVSYEKILDLNEPEFEVVADAEIQVEKALAVRGLPTLPQAFINRVLATEKESRRGILAWHSTGSGKTCTATGAMESFWDDDRQIVFASSQEAISSNPPANFHKCAFDLFPRFGRMTMAQVADEFDAKGIQILTFAKLSNRIVKGEAMKKGLGIKKGGNVRGRGRWLPTFGSKQPVPPAAPPPIDRVPSRPKNWWDEVEAVTDANANTVTNSKGRKKAGVVQEVEVPAKGRKSRSASPAGKKNVARKKGAVVQEDDESTKGRKSRSASPKGPVAKGKKSVDQPKARGRSASPKGKGKNVAQSKARGRSASPKGPVAKGKKSVAQPAPKGKKKAVVVEEEEDEPVKGRKSRSASPKGPVAKGKKSVDQPKAKSRSSSPKGKKSVAQPAPKGKKKAVVEEDEPVKVRKSRSASPKGKGKGKKSVAQPLPRKKAVVVEEEEEPIKGPKGKNPAKKSVAKPAPRKKVAVMEDGPKGKANRKKKIIQEDQEDLDDEILLPSPTAPKKLSVVEVVCKRYGIEDRARVRRVLAECKIAAIDDFVDLDKTVLIVDEVHNLFKPPAHQKKQYKLVEKHLVTSSMHPGLKVVILTATPGSTVEDCLVLLNIINPNDKPPIKAPNPQDADSVNAFREALRGLVSFYDMSGDTSRFPVVADPGPLRIPMSVKQFDKYIEAYKDVKEEFKDYDKLAKNIALGKFWQGARRYANMLYTFDKSLQLGEFSAKMPMLLEKLDAAPDQKHYVYSAFYENRGSSQGILEIARQLEAKGYAKMTVGEAAGLVKGGAGALAALAPAKRYILALNSELSSGTASAKQAADASRNMSYLMKVWNDDANAAGALVHCFLASQSFNEGLDMKAVRHIHIFEPLVTMASDLQTIGRARRNCSHAQLPHEQWTVQIHRYFAELPVSVRGHQEVVAALDALKAKDMTDLGKREVAAHNKEIKEMESLLDSDVKAIDEVVYAEAKKRMLALFTVYKSMEEAAVDCVALEEFHSTSRSYEGFRCLV